MVWGGGGATRMSESQSPSCQMCGPSQVRKKEADSRGMCSPYILPSDTCTQPQIRITALQPALPVEPFYQNVSYMEDVRTRASRHRHGGNLSRVGLEEFTSQAAWLPDLHATAVAQWLQFG